MSKFQEQVALIPKGHYKRIDINIARLPSHTLIDMPVFVFRGKKEGHCLLLTAGIHGDEINGITILRRLIARRMLMPDNGTVVVIPLVNVYGFLQNTRTLPDGKDLNRSFPGAASGSLAKQIAHIVMQEVIPLVDFGIDFHTGGNRITNYPQIRCVLAHEKNKELATYFNAPFTMNSPLISNSFRKEAFNVGKSILVYEGGESLRLDDLSINEGMAGVQRTMHHLGMKTDLELEKPQKSIILEKTSWLRAKISGIFESYVNYGDALKKDQVIAQIIDPYGRTNHTIKSPRKGYVVGINNMPVINAGDALVHIGNE